ncbi:MAG: hypothetical protein DBX55_03200 [Verrucomicrobia bacterium]|nr:MAG: hypothetical protein DBX55_03200 [Verrucomicrobiota bacterium]
MKPPNNPRRFSQKLESPRGERAGQSGIFGPKPAGALKKRPLSGHFPSRRTPEKSGEIARSDAAETPKSFRKRKKKLALIPYVYLSIPFYKF